LEDYLSEDSPLVALSGMAGPTDDFLFFGKKTDFQGLRLPTREKRFSAGRKVEQLAIAGINF
jgi:hypothetical protein